MSKFIKQLFVFVFCGASAVCFAQSAPKTEILKMVTVMPDRVVTTDKMTARVFTGPREREYTPPIPGITASDVPGTGTTYLGRTMGGGCTPTNDWRFGRIPRPCRELEGGGCEFQSYGTDIWVPCNSMGGIPFTELNCTMGWTNTIGWYDDPIHDNGRYDLGLNNDLYSMPNYPQTISYQLFKCGDRFITPDATDFARLMGPEVNEIVTLSVPYQNSVGRIIAHEMTPLVSVDNLSGENNILVQAPGDEAWILGSVKAFFFGRIIANTLATYSFTAQTPGTPDGERVNKIGTLTAWNVDIRMKPKDTSDFETSSLPRGTYVLNDQTGLVIGGSKFPKPCTNMTWKKIDIENDGVTETLYALTTHNANGSLCNN